MKLGSNDIAAIYLGNSTVSKVYLGSQLVWTSAPSTVPYTAEIETPVGGAAPIFTSVSGWTPDTPFNFPMIAGEALQTRNASDTSPITIVAGYNNTAKGASVILWKNSVQQQAKPVSGASPPQTFDPITIENGDTEKVQGN